MINEKILRVYFFYIDKIFLYDLNYKKSFKLKVFIKYGGEIFVYFTIVLVF